MRIIARSTLMAYAQRHSETRPALIHWEVIVRASRWQHMQDVAATFPKAKVLNGDRVRFEIAGGNHRLIAAIDFERSVVFVKFLGTHAEYDKVDALTVAIY
jgi:mRNA interferase HigB